MLASPTVLIETHAEGKPVTRYTMAGGRRALTAAQRHFIVRRGVEIYLKMLLLDNLMWRRRDSSPLPGTPRAAVAPYCSTFGWLSTLRLGCLIQAKHRRAP